MKIIRIHIRNTQCHETRLGRCDGNRRGVLEQELGHLAQAHLRIDAYVCIFKIT